LFEFVLQLSDLIQHHKLYREYYSQTQDMIIAEAVAVACTYQRVFQQIATSLAELDCVCALAQAAVVNNWACPTLLSKSASARAVEGRSPRLELIGLRHPCLESSLGSSSYISSDVSLQNDEVGAIITGPNMGGKSTVLRAIGIAVILAQMGSFIAATRACMQIFDRICIRTGASDSVSEGVSTFMSEMNDVVGILDCVSNQSLVIIDELGRGTSTHEGFGLAYAIMKSLVKDVHCTTLFATHFHELTMLADSNGTGMGHNEDADAKIINLCVRATVIDRTNEVVMEYALQRGVCEHSYGVQVARMAGFPEEIVSEAGQLATLLETKIH
jgi:DNA mismatch repair protein MSH2